jgi:hypothetical protein
MKNMNDMINEGPSGPGGGDMMPTEENIKEAFKEEMGRDPTAKELE